MQGTSGLRRQSPSVSQCLEAAPSPVLGQCVCMPCLASSCRSGHGDSSSSRGHLRWLCGHSGNEEWSFVPGLCVTCGLRPWAEPVEGLGWAPRDGQRRPVMGPGVVQSHGSMQRSQGVWGWSLPTGCPCGDVDGKGLDPGSLYRVSRTGNYRTVFRRDLLINSNTVLQT